MSTSTVSPSLRQLHLLSTPPMSPESRPNTTRHTHFQFTDIKKQRRQSSISYHSPGLNHGYNRYSFEGNTYERRSSLDEVRSYSAQVTTGPMSPTNVRTTATRTKHRPRPLSICVPQAHIPAQSLSRSTATTSSSSRTPPLSQPQPQTLPEKHAPLLSKIARQESLVSDLRSQLAIQEKELEGLKKVWEGVCREHFLGNGDGAKEGEKDKVGGEREGVGERIRRVLEGVAPLPPLTVADKEKESRTSLDSSSGSSRTSHSDSPSLHTSTSSTTTTCSTPDTSLDLPLPSKLTSLTHTHKPSNTNPSLSRHIRPQTASRAALPGTALSLLPSLTLEDLKSALPSHKRRASRVFEGIGSYLGIDLSTNTGKERDLEKEGRSGAGTPLIDLEEEGELDFTASPSLYLTRDRDRKKTPVNIIKEERDGDESDEWNW